MSDIQQSELKRVSATFGRIMNQNSIVIATAILRSVYHIDITNRQTAYSRG
jgi:hypothetical protein